jgi:glycosyltransferase involved in cell wall biosynthesis
VRVGVIRQGFYTLDPRVRREVAALADAGYEVDVVCLRRPGEPRTERRGRVTVHRLPPPSGGYVARYALFGAAAAALATALCARRRWDVVQVNTLPDALVFAAAGPRALGAGVLLDLHEVMPEFFATKFGCGPRHPAVRALERIEQAAIRFADRAITCTEPMRATFVGRGADPAKLGVVLNGADETVFDPARHPPRAREPGRFTLISHGVLEARYGLDTAIRAVARLREEIPGLELRIFGEGAEREALRRLARELGAPVRFSAGFVPIEELLGAIADADAGVVAMRRDAFRDLTHCNKMFDYIALRRPAIVSRTRSVEEYFDESCFALFESGDADDLARAIRALHADPALGGRLARRAAEVAEPYRWPHQRRAYLRAVSASASSAKNRSAEPRSVRWTSKVIRTAFTHNAASAPTAAAPTASRRRRAIGATRRIATTRNTRQQTRKGTPPLHSSQV